MVLKDYEPNKSGRGMKLQRDESIEIIHKGEIDWWFGRTSNGQVGWIPKEIVEAPEPQQVRIVDTTPLNYTRTLSVVHYM